MTYKNENDHPVFSISASSRDKTDGSNILKTVKKNETEVGLRYSYVR